MPATREVHYTLYQPREERLVASFVMVDVRPEQGVRHAVAMPKGWSTIEDVPVGDDVDGPQLSSLIVEDPELGPKSAVIVCGSATAAFGEHAKQVAEKLAASEGLSVYRWNDEDKDLGGARAMASSEDRIAALRVLPYEGQWIFFWAMGPTARLDKFGGAFKEGLSSFQGLPSWAVDLED